MGRALAAVCVLALLAATGCSTIETRQRDWSTYDGPGAEEFRAEEPPRLPSLDDPLQPLNRVLFDVNGALLDGVAAPITAGWRAISSRWVREHVENFGNNLEWPVRLVSNLCQLELGRAGQETGRFLINTTVGLLGFFDPAESWGLQAPAAQDMGLAFQAWGWDANVYVHVPVLGPSNDRDVVGSVFDFVLDPAAWFFPLRPALMLNEISDYVTDMQRLENASEDAYEIVRAAAALYRSGEHVDYGRMGSGTAAVRSLEAIFFDARDPDFFGRRLSLEATIPTTGRGLPYEVWLRDGTSPLVFVVPGLGTHRLSGQSVGFAEMAWEAGCSVVTLSSSMHPEFMARAATASVPGFVPWDVGDLRVALEVIQADLDASWPGRFPQRALAGLSLGALQVLTLATDPGGERWDAVLAIDPPVSIENALRQLDVLYRAPLRWPAEEREARLRNLVLKVVKLAEMPLEASAALPFEDIEAEYLIGLSFRWTLRSAIFDSQLRRPAGVLLTELDTHDREPAYAEIGEYGYMEYAYAFLLPAVEAQWQDVTDGKALFAHCDLRERAAALTGDARLHVLANRDDFLLEQGDIDWLERTLGERLSMFEEGGHLGNLARPGVRVVVVETLRKAVGLSRQP